MEMGLFGIVLANFLGRETEMDCFEPVQEHCVVQERYVVEDLVKVPSGPVKVVKYVWGVLLLFSLQEM